MRSRRFGIEIECGLRNNSTANLRNFLETVRARLGSEVHDSWNWTGRDGTFYEFRSPILQGREGFNELRGVLEVLNECGGYVTSADGMHIHLDAPDFVHNPSRVLTLVELWTENINFIYPFVHERRRAGGYRENCCPRWTRGLIQQLRSRADRTETPVIGFTRHDLNTNALRRHGSIEIRLHEGCIDPDQAEAWIRFGQALLDKAASVKRVKSETIRCPEDLLKRLRVSKRVQEILLAKAERLTEVAA